MGESVWIDELYTSSLFCGHPLVLAKTLYSDIHPPAYFLFMHGWIALLGDGEWALRLPPLILGLGSLVLVQRLGRRLFSEPVGWIAAWGMTLSPTHIWYSTEGRPYAANLFLALACLALYLRDRERPSLGRHGVLALVLTLTAWSHYYLAAIPAGILAWEMLERPRGWRARALAGALALGLAVGLVLGKAYLSEVPTSKGYLRSFGLLEWWRLWFVWFPTGSALQPLGSQGLWGAGLHRVLPWGWFALFALGVVSAWRQNRRALGWVLGLGAAIPAGLWVLAWAGHGQVYIERSALPSMPFVYLLMAVGFQAVRQRLGRRHAIGDGIALAVGATVLLAFVGRGDQWTVYKPNPDWRGLSAALGARLAGAEPPVRILSDYPSPTPLTYYDPRFQETKFFAYNQAKWERAFDRLGGLPAVGPWLSKRVTQLSAEWQEHQRVVAAATQVWMDELVVAAPDLNVPSVGTVWLLIHGAPTVRAQALMNDPRVECGDPLSTRGLVVYPLRW